MDCDIRPNYRTKGQKPLIQSTKNTQKRYTNLSSRSKINRSKGKSLYYRKGQIKRAIRRKHRN